MNGSKAHEGRVEVYYAGVWGTVCNDDWDMNDANIVCKMLGYSGAEISQQMAYFGEGRHFFFFFCVPRGYCRGGNVYIKVA